MGPTPLLDFFKRGEVARDVRLVAAQGALAPRAHEQLSILIILLDDTDPEVRRTAEETLGRIPAELLSTFLARADVSMGVREFFADRGIFAADVPAGDEQAEAPLYDAEAGVEYADVPPGEDALASEEERRSSVQQQLAKMGFTERLKAAVKGTREMRAILVRDPNKMISSSVLSSPKITENEVEAISRMANVSEDVLRIIATNRAWMKNYQIALGLTKNPKTPLGMSMNIMARLNDRDLTQLSVDRNVPEPLRVAARKKVVSATSKK
jgi:hypothetical protein